MKIVYLELLGLNLEAVKKHEIVSESVIETFLDMQNESEAESLRQQDMEICYIKATRGDKGYNRNLSGSLCRGEFMEFLLRLANFHHGEGGALETLPVIFKNYLEPLYQKSTIKSLRKTI